MRLFTATQFTALLLVSLSACSVCAPAAAAPPPADLAARSVVVISDLHMGLGRDAEGAWRPTEDFRWPVALEAFLEAVAAEGNGAVDLLIAGDFLELWQRPATIPCAGPPGAADYGCSVRELADLATAVVDAHRRELAALSRFAATGGNCVVVVPGNHDAGLVLDPVWQPLERALTAGGGCVRRVTGGVWSSTDGRVVVEHGHQIGRDANKYPDWPRITRRFGDTEYVRQPWGESFVQGIFNSEEADYPLIDNLSPSSAGVRYRMAERGLFGSARDVARFVRFNLFDTSLRQKVQILGDEGEDEGETKRWDLAKARGLGHRLFAGALGTEDPFADALRGGEDDWAQVQAELDGLARTLPAEEVSSLCDQLAIRGGPDSCEFSTLGLAVSRLLASRQRVLRRHFGGRRDDFPQMKVFVYGHTHSFELPWELTWDPVTVFRVANSGAFQRLVDDEQLRDLAAAAGLTPGEFLGRNTPEELPACYTSVHVSAPTDGVPTGIEVRAWHMPEDAETGRFVDPCKSPCPRVGHGCRE